MEVAELPESARTELRLLRELWAATRKANISGTVPLVDELESYVQTSLGDLGLELKSCKSAGSQPVNFEQWHVTLNIAGKAAELLASVARRTPVGS